MALLGIERWVVSYQGLLVTLEAPVFTPGTEITITVPITSRSNASVRTKINVNIYEGSILPGAGTQLGTVTSSEYTMAPNEVHNFTVNWTTVRGSTDRRDVGVEVYYWNGSQWVMSKSAQFDDVYFVREPNYAFDIGQPVAAKA